MKKNNKYIELMKNTGVLAIANFSSKILVFLLVPLYTSLLTTTEYGFFDLTLTTIQLILPILSMNVIDGILRFCIDKKNDVNQVIKISFKYMIISIILVFLLLQIIVLSGISSTTSKYWTLIFIYYVAYLFNQGLPQLAKGIDRVKDMAISGVIGTLATVIGCIIFLYLLDFKLYGFYIAYILGQLIPAIYLINKLDIVDCMKEHTQINKELEKSFLKYSRPLILTNIGWWVNNTSDRYIITFFLGMNINGLLSVAYKIPSILSVIYGLFTQAWQISAMKEYGKKESAQFYNNIFIYLNIFVYWIAAFLIILTKPVSSLLYANDFFSAWRFVPFLLISGVFTASAGFIAPILTSTYETKSVALSTVYGAIVNVIFNIVLIKLIGAEGVSIATAISSFVILYIRYKSLNNIIDKKVFYKCFILWILLVLQALCEINNIYFCEIFLIIFAGVFCIKDLINLIDKIIRMWRKKC